MPITQLIKSNMENNQRDFKWIWISKEIWLNEDLSIMEKVLLVEITSLDWENGCFASNAYFAKFFGIAERNIISHISRLKEKGLIYVESFDWRQRTLRSSLNSAMTKSSGQNGWNHQGTHDEIIIHNNTVNNTSTSSVSKDTTEVDVAPKLSRVKRKKEFIKTPLPTKEEFFSFIWKNKGKEKFYEMISSVNPRQNFSLQDMKTLYEWMIEFFKDKFVGKFYMDKDGNYIWSEIVFNQIDRFTWWYLDHPEEEIRNMKWRLTIWITKASEYASSNK